MVPIKDNFFMADLALELGLAIVIVVDNKLGAINHTLLTLEYAYNKGLKVLAVLLNSVNTSNVISSNMSVLKRIVLDIPIFEIKFLSGSYGKWNYYNEFNKISNFLIDKNNK